MEDTNRRGDLAGQFEDAAQRDTMAEEEAPESSLDVSSESFDPLLALYSPRTPLPFPNVRCFNNLSEYESFLRGGGRGRGVQRGAGRARSRKGRKPEPDPGRIERLKQLMLPVDEERTPAKPRKKREPKNVLTRMTLHAGSPLGELNRCVQDRIRIKVHTRTFKGLRGVCSGFIVAFDKFWNMAMVDVDETYRKPILGKAFYNEPQLTLTRLFDRLKLQESGSQPSAVLQDVVPKKQPIHTSSTRPPRRENTENLLPSCSRGHERKSDQLSDRTTGQVETAKIDQTGEKTRQRTKRKKEKVDYQQVFTRHMKQVFIRGESILLVHLSD
ncbi:U7 snRNA-associated Sm-like protein LSm11 [Rhinophrynus dorsalis]